MPFGRTGRQNRSQHSLVEPSAAGAGPPPPAGQQQSQIQTQSLQQNAGPGPALSASSTDSFERAIPPQLQQQGSSSQQQLQQPPLPPAHGVNVFGPAGSQPPQNPSLQQQQQQQPLQHGHSQSVFDARQHKAAQDFADSVNRSQSQRYPQVTTPIHPQQIHPGFASSSVDDLPAALHAASSNIPQGQPGVPHHQQAPPPEPKRSTRRLIKNILSGNSGSASARDHYDNTGGLARRHSKRVSNPPAIRTGPSQVSLENQPLDWQHQGPHTQPSPLQGNPHENQHPTIRRVNTNDHETSPYGPDDIGYRQQGHVQVQGQIPPELQQQFSQITFDPATQQYQYTANSPQAQYPGGQPQVYTGHLSTNSQQNVETVSQLSRESPITDPDQNPLNLQSEQTSPAVTPAVNYVQVQEVTGRQVPPPAQPQAQQQQGQGQQQQQTMAPPPGGPPPNRRSQDTEKNNRSGQVEPPPGPPPGYRHSQQPGMNNPLPPPPPSATGNNPNYRQSTIQERQQYESQSQGEGRNSPQPSGDAEQDKAFKDLLTKYKNVKRLYFDGKTQIEQLNSQVEQLQNAIANQRMSQSRTSLDDNEYTTRFNRLNGAINNLSFNIRKDWVTLPSWLDRFVSADALKTGKQEMTAVGRAVITRWVVEEIFNRCFHPGLDPELSNKLKEIEHNIRRFSYTMNSQEEFDALTSKVVSWRMATLEGLQRELGSTEATNHRQDFTRRATSNLTASLFQHLSEPPPAGVDGSASMIVELAVGIAANLSLESRDVAVTYPHPLDTVQPGIMDVEKTALPPIETKGDGEADDDDDSGQEEKGGKDRKSRAGMSTISNLLSNAPSSLVPGSGGRKGSASSPSGQAVTDSAGNAALPPKDSNKVRFAGFMAVEVRGRQVLVKAPVWTLG